MINTTVDRITSSAEFLDIPILPDDYNNILLFLEMNIATLSGKIANKTIIDTQY